jgi:hypothetical protein
MDHPSFGGEVWVTHPWCDDDDDDDDDVTHFLRLDCSYSSILYLLQSSPLSQSPECHILRKRSLTSKISEASLSA